MIQAKVAIGKRLEQTDFGNEEYNEVDFSHTRLEGSDLSKASFVSCKFNFASLKDCIFKLSCDQGSGNKLDQFNAAMFMFWFDTVFDLPDDFHRLIDSLISPWREKLSMMFDVEEP
ncbi:MAG TPA: hypothetical protein ENI26_14135 [Methylophaga aminisulfidivorans]|uniref:Pentapeptide repeat-containing protein n=1 Tax=Methylophaga aminisulfidivorans TaxID=230105 RepID=A0A7C1ZTU9_9GAMM|nr:hypothetical protein [Methylophaga aminisulfidivorans]